MVTAEAGCVIGLAQICNPPMTTQPRTDRPLADTPIHRYADTLHALTLLPLLLLLTLLALLPAHAFPPSPHHLFYGIVRDETGNPLFVNNAEVFLQTSSGTQIKAAIVPNLEPGLNYRLAVPMDAGLTQDLYKPTALRPTVPFKLQVRIGKAVYLPVEMSGDYARMGQPAQSTRIDLTLGEDADGDGLPDAWEKALLALSGGSKTLKDIKPGDDFDGDGLSNLQEYLAGTYAFDDKDGFSLKAVRKNGPLTVLEFLSIRGRSYTIYGSNDLQQWTTASFRVSSQTPPGSFLSQFQATDTKVVQVEVDPRAGTGTMRFFKLMVQ